MSELDLKGRTLKSMYGAVKTTFCYFFYPLGVITERWMTEGEHFSMKEPAAL